MEHARALEALTARMTTYRADSELSLDGMANAAGVSIGTIRRIERGENISVSTLLRIAENLEVSVGYLLGDESEGHPARVLDPLIPFAAQLAPADVETLVAMAKRLVGVGSRVDGFDLDGIDREARESIARNIREQQAEGSRRRAADQRQAGKKPKQDDESDDSQQGRGAG